MGEDVVGEIGLNLLVGQFALLGADFATEDAQANGVAQLVTMRRREGKRLARALKPRQRLPRVGVWRAGADQEAGVGVGRHWRGLRVCANIDSGGNSCTDPK
jgi:hypothetical protein